MTLPEYMLEQQMKYFEKSLVMRRSDRKCDGRKMTRVLITMDRVAFKSLKCKMNLNLFLLELLHLLFSRTFL